ncbi:MAG: hypothetical protein ACI31W_08070 [Lactococcus sp.]
MPKNNFQTLVFTFITVFFTVLAFVFYSVYVINGSSAMTITHTSSVLAAIHAQGGLYMFGTFLPIWAVIVIEIIFAFTLEVAFVGKYALKRTMQLAQPESTHPLLVHTTMVFVTVSLMCPAMSFIAAWSFYPYQDGFNFLTLLANWLKLICYNLPFAFFAQLFFIQPLVKKIFAFLFREKKAATRQVA